MAASVHERLLNKSKSDVRPFNELLQYYALERFLYRLSQTSYKPSVVLKGAMMLRVWKASEIRPTLDIDFLGKMKNNEALIATMVKEIAIAQIAEADGLTFDPESVATEPITEDADYNGVRVRFIGKLGNARIPMQIDLGFGDSIYPGAVDTELPAMLGFPPAKILCYTKESSIAEKFQAAVHLGDANSRMKDFYDIRLLSRQFNFQAKELAEAFSRTFKTRGTPMPVSQQLFSSDFAKAKQIQWTAFRNKLKIETIPESFKEVLNDVEAFLQPIAIGIADNAKMPKEWKAPGGWV